jgi:hypothetical protein
VLVMPVDGKGPGALRYLECDRIDPLQLPSITAWLVGELRPRTPSQGRGRAQIVVELKRKLPFEIVWGSQGGAAECCADPKYGQASRSVNDHPRRAWGLPAKVLEDNL